MKVTMNSFLKYHILTLILILLLSSCSVKKSDIMVPLAEPLPHPQLSKMEQIRLFENDGMISWADSRKFIKNGIKVVVLKGNPYELGYARGKLLKHELHTWTRDCIYMIKRIALGDVGISLALSRAKELHAFIPEEFKEEIMGVSAASGIDYNTLMMLNVLDTIGRSFACTSVAVRKENGEMIRSRSLDFKDVEYLSQPVVQIYQPRTGNAFLSLNSVGSIGVYTAINEKGLNFGVHDITGAKASWKSIPSGMISRWIIQHTDTVPAVVENLKQFKRSLPRMIMVTDPQQAAVIEYNSKKVATLNMSEDHLILTNYTRMLNIGRVSENSQNRFNEAKQFLKNIRTEMTETKLIDLNRQYYISKVDDNIWLNIHSAVFNSNTLDIWVALDSPQASRGRWIKFNLKNVLYQSGLNSDPEVIQPID
jgi:hypothetical protein